MPVGYGLPYELDHDESNFVKAAWQMIEGGDLDSGWYGHPASTLFDVVALLYAAYGATGTHASSFDSIRDAGTVFLADVNHSLIIARVVTATTGVAVVLATYAVARELRIPAHWADIAALMLALSWPLIEFSTLVRADMLLSTFLLLVVLVMFKSLENLLRLPRVHLHAAAVVAALVVAAGSAGRHRGGLPGRSVGVLAAVLVGSRRVHPDGRGAVRLGTVRGPIPATN